jgi:tRNA G18 (ribose-2'-O)-methylase SpoU
MRKRTFHEIFLQRPDVETIEREGRFPIYVVAENIRSLYNVGSIFRTSDGARIQKLFLCGYTGFPPRNEISKTALGAEKTVPWEYHRSAREVILRLKDEGIPVILLEQTDRSHHYARFRYPFPLCLVIGNEVEGISDDVVELADAAVEIPMFGIKHSLNVAVAYGVVLFEILRQYLESR